MSTCGPLNPTFSRGVCLVACSSSIICKISDLIGLLCRHSQNKTKQNLEFVLLIRYFASVRYWRKKWVYNGTIHQIFIDFEKAYDSVRREVLCNILIEFGIPVKLVKLIKMYLNDR